MPGGTDSVEAQSGVSRWPSPPPSAIPSSKPILPQAPARAAPAFERRDPELDLMGNRPTRRSTGVRAIRLGIVVILLSALGAVSWLAYDDLSGAGSSPAADVDQSG
jgi:hypothetical protein